jgi:hypothetical protein
MVRISITRTVTWCVTRNVSKEIWKGVTRLRQMMTGADIEDQHTASDIIMSFDTGTRLVRRLGVGHGLEAGDNLIVEEVLW